MVDQPYAVMKRSPSGKWEVDSTHYNRIDAGTAASELMYFAFLNDMPLEVKVAYDPTGLFLN